MEYADIVAPQWAPKFRKRPYRMLLAQWVLRSKPYAKYHERLRRTSKAFVILDNGAFEGADLSLEQLETAASRVRPDEIVLQDVRHDSKATLKKSWECLQRLQDLRGLSSVLFVPHGRSLDEWSYCLDAWIEVWNSQPRPVTLTIGVHGMRDQGQKVHAQPQMKASVMNLASATGYPMHMLGCGDVQAFCQEELAVAHQLGVRGVDSSLPFAIGVRMKLLTPATKKVWLGDVEQYCRFTLRHQRLVKLNINIFRHWIETGEAKDEIPVEVIRQTCREWRKYYARGLATVEEVMKSCHVPKGWYAIRMEEQPRRRPKAVGVRPLASTKLLGHRGLREGEVVLQITY